MREIRILHLLYAGPGGLGSYFMNFVKGDHQKRFDHHAFFYGIEPVYVEYTKFCASREIPYHFHHKGKSFDLEVYQVIRRYILHWKIDAVIFHTFSLTPLLVLRYNLPVQWIAIDHTSYAFKTRKEKIFTLVHHLLADCMIYFQRDQFKTLQKTFPFITFGKKSLILTKTIDHDLFYRVYRKEPPIFTVGMAARMVPGKRFDLILRTIQAMRSAGMIICAKFAGDGPMRASLESQCDMLQIKDYIQFEGVLPPDAMPSFYDSLSVYVHATEGETVCYSIMEAQAAGLPVLASDVKGVNNVDELKGALLFKNSVDDLVKAITSVYQDQEYRLKLSHDMVQFSKKASLAASNAEILYNRLLPSAS